MKVSEALKSLLVKVTDKEVGICNNLECVYGGWFDSDILREGFITWPSYSGTKSFPIEGSFYKYCMNGRKWDRRTKYGKLRYDLLNHLIKFFEERGE